MLKVKGLSIKFGSRVIFNNFSYDFKKGSVYILAGKNGSGKTTLLNAISNEFNDYSGSITIDGNKNSITDISYFTQFYEDSFFSDTVKKEIKNTIAFSNSNLSYDDIRDIFSELGSSLSDIEDKNPFALNITTQKLLVFILSIIKPHKIILADELDSSFDIKTKFLISKFLIKESEKKPVIIVSHDNYFINRCRGKIIYLENNGTYLCFDSVKEYFSGKLFSENRDIKYELRKDEFLSL